MNTGAAEKSLQSQILDSLIPSPPFIPHIKESGAVIEARFRIASLH